MLTYGAPASQGNLVMAAIAAVEACDSNAALLQSGDLPVLQPIFKIYGQGRAFSGPIVTLKVFGDNVLVGELLETRGEGRVLVIDGGESMKRALVGKKLRQLAQNMDWVGIVGDGCIREVDEINACANGVRAVASHPLKSNKEGISEKQVPEYIGGTVGRDKEWLYADSDSILISKPELSSTLGAPLVVTGNGSTQTVTAFLFQSRSYLVASAVRSHSKQHAA